MRFEEQGLEPYHLEIRRQREQAASEVAEYLKHLRERPVTDFKSAIQYIDGEARRCVSEHVAADLCNRRRVTPEEERIEVRNTFLADLMTLRVRQIEMAFGI